MGRYWPITDTKHVINIEECLNADSVVGKLQNVGGIVGQGDKYSLRVERCVNIGSISNVNAKLAAGTPGAGGIVGGGIPVINNCFNAGVISGINCLGGILGRVPDNASTATITNCTNTAGSPATLPQQPTSALSPATGTPAPLTPIAGMTPYVERSGCDEG